MFTNIPFSLKIGISDVVSWKIWGEDVLADSAELVGADVVVVEVDIGNSSETVVS